MSIFAIHPEAFRYGVKNRFMMKDTKKNPSLVGFGLLKIFKE